MPVDGADRSIRFHSCYGPLRQVQALRDALLHLLSHPDNGLAEEDILVLCPDLDRFAPLVEAVFGRSSDRGVDGGPPAGRGAPALRFRIADQSIRTTNPLLGAAAALLELVAGRFEVPAVLDFLALAPVRQRFRFDDDDLSTIAEWVAGTEVRWGFDPQPARRVRHTRGDRVQHLAGRTRPTGAREPPSTTTTGIWRWAALPRSGWRAATSRSWAAWPRRIRRLADLAERDPGDRRPVESWIALVRQATADVFAAPPDAAWQMEGLHRILAEVLDAATRQGTVSPVPLTFGDIRRLFDEQLNGKVGRPDFFRGGVTVTSMTPLRWVPFRVVCILGMDQASFGSPAPAADDLIAAASRPGDRDPRAEARQALLEAVLAAGDHLVVVRDGRDVRTNQEIPRSLVAAELFEAVSGAGRCPGAPGSGRRSRGAPSPPSIRREVLRRRCAGSGRTVGLRSVRPRGSPGQAPASGRGPPLPGGPAPRQATPRWSISPTSTRFLKNPAAAFVTQALEVRLPRREERLSTVLPVSLERSGEVEGGGPHAHRPARRDGHRGMGRTRACPWHAAPRRARGTSWSRSWPRW